MLKAPPFTPAHGHPARQVPELPGQSEAEAQPGSEDACAFLALGLLHTLPGQLRSDAFQGASREGQWWGVWG